MTGIRHIDTVSGRSSAGLPGHIAPDWPELIVPERSRRGLLLKRTIEDRILPHLLQLHPRADAVSAAIDLEQVQALARNAATGDPALLFSCLEALLDGGITRDALCLDVLAPAARHLGDLWTQDEYDFTEVTIGVARLQQALRHLEPARRPAQRRGSRLPTILLVPVPGEQHHFGLAMAADFFRRAGWSVTSGASPSLEALKGLVRQRRFDIAGFSISCERHAGTLARALAAIREHSCNPATATMVGGPLVAANPELVIQLGADAVAGDGAQAPMQATQLLLEQGDAPGTARGRPPRAGLSMTAWEPLCSENRASPQPDGNRVQQAGSGNHQEARAGRG